MKKSTKHLPRESLGDSYNSEVPSVSSYTFYPGFSLRFRITPCFFAWLLYTLHNHIKQKMQKSQVELFYFISHLGQIVNQRAVETEQSKRFTGRTAQELTFCLFYMAKGKTITENQDSKRHLLELPCLFRDLLLRSYFLGIKLFFSRQKAETFSIFLKKKS